MIVAHRYLVERVEGTEVFRVRNLDAPLCPDCGSLCSGYDTRFGASSAAAVVAPVAAVAFQSEEPVSAPAPVHEAPPASPPGFTAGSIALPGFVRLTASGQTLHAAEVSNPAANSCYFIVTFIMPDGSEVYRSSYLAPGQSLGDVEFSQQVEPGTYERAVVRYSCFALDDMRPLNGADIAFTLEVQP